MSKYKQVIVVRKDLLMSKGKMAAQVAHAASAFLVYPIRDMAKKLITRNERIFYSVTLPFGTEIIENWFQGDFTKIILEAKNKDDLLKLIKKADLNDIKYYPIYDKCYTELTPEEENGTCLTVVGFPPLSEEVIDPIVKRYQLFKE